MNEHAILHIVDSSYCFPISKNEITLRLRTAKNDVQKVWVIYESKYEIGKKQKKCELEKLFSGTIYDYYSVTLSLKDTRIGYVFYIFDGQNYRYFSEDGLTEKYNFEKGYFNFFQYPYINEADILPQIEWTRNAVCYQIFVDRFFIGDTDENKSYINLKWGGKPSPKSFAGGDIPGITQKLDYLKELGINTIYLTPIFKSVSNHKYDISDYYQIDRQFGTNEDLKELIDKAHQMGIRIILDAVFNHCSDDLDLFVDVVKKGKASEYYDYFIIHGDKPSVMRGNYEMFAHCHYMPKWNTSNPKVQQYLNEIGCYYIREYDIDGWRLDVSDEVSHDFWRSFRRAIKAEKADCILIGENWHDASNYLRGDQYDSIMNYAFTKACLDYFATGDMDANAMACKLNDILIRNTDTVNAMMLNLLDSHDTHRFFSEVKEDKRSLLSALALLFLFPGIPCIFYGTEFYTPGGYDPDCRRCMDWKGFEEGKYEDPLKAIRELTKLRADYDLSSAKCSITAKDDILIVKRMTDTVELSLWINMTDHKITLDNIEIDTHSFVMAEFMK